MAQLENFRLRVFRAVAKHLNFRKAAEELLLTQPAVTLQIQALEDELGVRLFDRGPNRVTLTPHGKILLRYAAKLEALAAEAEQTLGAEDGKLSGALSLGVSTTIAQYVLPRLIGPFLAEHPRVEFSLHSGNTGQIVEWLLRGTISLGLIEGPARERGVRAEAFLEDELVLIAPPDFSGERVTPRQIEDWNLLMREQGSGTRRVVEAAFARAGVKPKSFRSVMNLDSTEAIKSAVSAGLGIGFVSRWAIAKEVELGELRTAEVAGLRMTRNFSIVTRTGPAPQGPPGAFRAFALTRGRELSRKPAKRGRTGHSLR